MRFLAAGMLDLLLTCLHVFLLAADMLYLLLTWVTYISLSCKVEILAPKVEITLKKADGTNWTDLGTLLCSAVEDA